MMDEDGPPPEDLPKSRASVAVEASAPADPTRVCEKCGSVNVRIISNYDGRRGICGQCKHWWTISMCPVTLIPRGVQTRGLSKETAVQPNWDLAYEDLDELPEWKK